MYKGELGMFCRDCGKEIGNSNFCSACGTSAQEIREQIVSTAERAAVNFNEVVCQTEYTGVSNKYREKFKEIDAKNGDVAIMWNWWAFFLTPFWYLVQGMWAKALLIFVISLFTHGLAAPLFWFYGGLLGTYDYYLLKAKKKQLW